MNIYPYFDYRPMRLKVGNRVIIRGELCTRIRKKFDGIYYLCKLIMQYQQPVSEFRRMKIPRKSYDNWIMNILLQEVMIEAYRMIKFGTLNENLRDQFGSPIGFQIDPDQRTEKERLTE